MERGRAPDTIIIVSDQLLSHADHRPLWPISLKHECIRITAEESARRGRSFGSGDVDWGALKGSRTAQEINRQYSNFYSSQIDSTTQPPVDSRRHVVWEYISDGYDILSAGALLSAIATTFVIRWIVVVVGEKEVDGFMVIAVAFLFCNHGQLIGM